MGNSRKMKMHLTPGTFGVRGSQVEVVEWAHYYGWEAVEPQTDFLMKATGDEVKALRERMGSMNLVWGAGGMGVDFRAEDAAFTEGMKNLPAQARALQRAGVTRMGTWIRPGHDKWTARQYFDMHVARLSQVADVLAEHGLRLGLEYVGPKTAWSRSRYPFVHTMAEMKELLAAMGKKNTGFVLDSWHWYTAGENKADILTLKNSDVVTVDLNDAPAGVAVDQQVDSKRELPCATGVIDVSAFLNALNEIGYDGPVRPEPFNEAVRKMPREQALQTTFAAMQKAFALIS